MPQTVNIDFETRNTVDIKAGASKYANTAIILCLAYSIDGGEVKAWRAGQIEPKDLLDAVANGATLVAWNAAFERQIWQKVCIAQWGWPKVAKWKCTMAAALACGLPGSLENAAKALMLDVEKDMAGRRLMLKMSKPRKPTKKDPSVWHDKPAEYDKLLAYCAQDVRTEMAVGEIVDDLSVTEQGVYEYDHTVNARGVKFDIPLVENCIKVWSKYVAKLNAEMQQITFGGATTSEVAKIVSIAQSIGAPVQTLDKRAVSHALTAEGVSPTVKRMLELRQSAAKSSVAKFKRILQCAEEDGRIRGCTQYHGARTGRFAGRLIQLQNLPRGVFSEQEIDEGIIERMADAIMQHDIQAIEGTGHNIGDVLGSMVRSSIIGQKLIACDFASIEARCLAWLAGEKWLLDAYRNDEDAYKHMASSIYNVKYDDVTKDQRWWGKSLILGAGYGLGAGGLVRLLDSAGVKTTEKEAKVLIDAYRAKNKAIVRYWYAIERAAVDAVRSGKPQKHGVITYHMKGRWLCCRLPSGRDIRYLDPKLVSGKFDKEQIEFTGIDITGKPVRETTYSGKLVENLDQGICRDLLVWAMSRLEKAGYPVVFHVHDEVVVETEHGTAEDVERIMTEVPDWAEGFPIDAEGFECLRYRK